MTFGALGKPFHELGQKPRRTAQPQPASKPRALRFKMAAPSYEKIKLAVMAAIAELPAQDKWRVPAWGTLPELIVALALIWLKLPFQCQMPENGGRMFLGGSVVDFLVWLGAQVVVVRVQGDFWHSLPGRKQKDLVQWERLHAKGYRVIDLWEGRLYQAWADGRIVEFVREGVYSAV